MPGPSRRGRGRGGREGREPRSMDTRRDPISRVSSRAAGNSLASVQFDNWKGSKVAHTEEDGGYKAFINFLERRAKIGQSKTHHGVSDMRPPRIRKSVAKGNSIIISVPIEDVSLYVHLDGFDFGGNEIRARELPGRHGSALRDADSRRSPAPTKSFSFKSSGTEKLKTELKTLLSRRYDPETKIMNLGSIFEEPEVKEIMAQPSNTASKLFAVLCAICEDVFPDKQTRRANITGLSLGNNMFRSLLPARPLAWEFPDLVNLDLSNNKIQSKADLNAFLKCTKIEHILLAGNPWLEHPNFKRSVLQSFPNLKFVDGAAVTAADRESIVTNHEIPPTTIGSYDDSTGIGQKFFQNFFLGFDTDREALVDYYYDKNSSFSYSINTKALKDPDSKVQTTKGEWDAWTYHSRNLYKGLGPPARAARKQNGSQSILKEFLELPSTQHASTSEPNKWMVESFPMTGLSDPTGQTKGGVNGLCVIVHGEFQENPQVAAKRKLRSFDRTFILGPGGSNPEGIVIVSDLLSLRNYGGVKAFEPESTIPKTAEEEQAAMVAEVQRQTGMNAHFSALCLEQTNWRIEAALESFVQANGNVPPEAFAQ